MVLISTTVASQRFTHIQLQNSLNVIEDALVDRTVEGAPPLTRFQFERQGYFCVDFDSSKEKVLLPGVLFLHAGFHIDWGGLELPPYPEILKLSILAIYMLLNMSITCVIKMFGNFVPDCVRSNLRGI